MASEEFHTSLWIIDRLPFSTYSSSFSFSWPSDQLVILAPQGRQWCCQLIMPNWKFIPVLERAMFEKNQHCPVISCFPTVPAAVSWLSRYLNCKCCTNAQSKRILKVKLLCTEVKLRNHSHTETFVDIRLWLPTSCLETSTGNCFLSLIFHQLLQSICADVCSSTGRRRRSSIVCNVLLTTYN